MINSLSLTKSVVKDFLINSIEIFDSSLDTKNLSCKDLALSLAELFEQEEDIQNISDKIDSQNKEELFPKITIYKIILFQVFAKLICNIIGSTLAYSEYEISQESFLSSKLGIINLENYSLFKDPKILSLYTRFNESADVPISSYLHNNFPQFCTSIAARIEVLIDSNISQKIGNLKNGKKFIKSKRVKLREWIDATKSKEIEKHRNIIEYIYDIRDCGCHFDSIGLSFEERSHQLYWTIKFRINNLLDGIGIEVIRDVFSVFLLDYYQTQAQNSKPTLSWNNPSVVLLPVNPCLSIRYDKKFNYAYIYLSKIRSEYIVGVESVQILAQEIKQKISQNDNIKKRFGDKYAILAEKLDPYYDKEKLEDIRRAEDLKEFANQSNYKSIISEFEWVLEQSQYFYEQKILK